MLPVRDSSGAIKQARIALGLVDVPADHKVAEKRRALLQRQVDTNTFNWDDWREATRGTTLRQANCPFGNEPLDGFLLYQQSTH